MKASKFLWFVILVLLCLAFIAAGFYLLWFGCGGSTEDTDCRLVTATLVSSTPYYVEEGDSEGTFMRTKYHCEWQYKIAGKTYTVLRDQAQKPAATTTLCTNHWMCTKSKGELDGDALLLSLAAFCIGGYGMHALVSDLRNPNRNESSASADE